VKKDRLAAIDIGTNSIRCIIVEADTQGKYRILDDEKATVRLGEGLARDNAISGAAWQRAVEALSRMKKIIDGYGVTLVETAATSAVRRAANGAAFISEVADTIGLEITIVSGEEEAELALASALHNFNMEGTRYALIDIGGGSVEIVTAQGHHIENISSLELGAVTLTDAYITSDPIGENEHQRLRKRVRKVIKNAGIGTELPVQCLIGSGGTMTSIAAMGMALRKEGYTSIHGYEVLRSEVVHLLAMLMRKNVTERRSVPGLHPDRADIIVAGMTVVDELMDFFSANLLTINERGIREGLILKALRKQNLLPAAPRPKNWREGLMEFARSCHNDEEHSRHVARIALEIFAPLAESSGFGDKERQMLEAAALLHDIGYFISYKEHHKHSYHLVRHADLFGFTPRERELIAHVARYHRKSLPKKSHEGFGRLSTQDQLLVRKLGGILRLADGLDRRRAGMVTAVDCSPSPSTFMIRLQSDGDVSVELFGGKAKGDLFEAAFDKKLILVPARGAAQLTAPG
jgi:exopolyphosphatase/guanosine-5'-triphosphate,3'-diphosphate pyrophosphatase